MAIKNAQTVETYDRGNLKPDVLEQLYYFEQEDTPVFSTSKKKKAMNTTVQWVEDSLDAVSATNYQIEGEEFTPEATSQIVLKKNYTQILTRTYSVTGTAQATPGYAEANTLPFQREKKLRAIKRDAEASLVRNVASVVGVSGTARRMAGLETWISTNASRGVGGAGTGYNSGTGLTAAATDGTTRPFTENIFSDLTKVAVDNGIKRGTKAKPTMLMANSNIQRQFADNFTGNQSRISETTDMASGSLSIYQNQFGYFVFKYNPQMRQRTAFLLDMSHIQLAMLRELQIIKDIAKTHDSDEEAWLMEFTSIVREKGHAVIADISG